MNPAAATPSLLVLTPTLGTSPYLEASLASVANLGLNVRHFLVCPAGEVETLGRRFPDLTVVPDQGRAGGLYGALNAGLAAADAAGVSWDWFTYINDDDLLSPGFAELVRRHCRPDRLASVAYGDILNVDPADRPLGRMTVERRGQDLPLLLQTGISPVGQQGMVFGAPVVRALGGYSREYRLCADLGFLGPRPRPRVPVPILPVRGRPVPAPARPALGRRGAHPARAGRHHRPAVPPARVGVPAAARAGALPTVQPAALLRAPPRARRPALHERRPARQRGHRRRPDDRDDPDPDPFMTSAEPLHVVLLNDFARYNGGASAVALGSARRLAALGHEVTLFSAVAPVAPELADVPNLRVVCLGQEEIVRDPRRLRALTRGAWNRPAARALGELLDGLEPARTVVHAHHWTKALSPSVFPAAFDRGFRVVVTLHDFFIVCPNGGFYVYPAGDICHRVPLSRDCLSCRCDRRNHGHKLWRAGRTWLQNRVVRLPERTAHFLAVSEFSLDVMRPFLPPDVPATVVRNPAECPDLGPAPVAENDRFVFVGRLVPEKGPRLFAEAARQAGVRAVFVGDGEMRAELARDFPEAEITGWQTPAEVTARLRQARALVFPSLWYETLGLVVVEALAHGVPVVVSDGCAARDVVTDDGRGLHFPAGSVGGLAERLRGLAGPDAGAARATRLGQAAYEWYRADPWTAESHVAALLDVYSQVLAAPPSPALPTRRGISSPLSAPPVVGV